jgi:hypothetical protein
MNSSTAAGPKAEGLFKLFDDEKRQEQQTRKMLEELEKNNEALQRAKMTLIEKLLDVQVKDVMSRELLRGDQQAFALSSSLQGAEAIRQAARTRLENEVKASAEEALIQFPDGFIPRLNKMVAMDEEKSRNDVRNMASQYVDPYIEKHRREQKKRRPAEGSNTLAAVAVAAKQVLEQQQKAVNEEAKLQDLQSANNRATRVKEAFAMFKKNIGDVQPLLYVVPKEYKTDIGVREAEINDLRTKLLSQRGEEERLLQERAIQLNLLDADQAKISAEVEQLQQQLVLMQREVETKELELREISEAQTPGSGSWANNTLQLERDLDRAAEDEFVLRQQLEEIRRAHDILAAEREALDGEISDSIAELTQSQQEQQSVLARLELRLTESKQQMFGMRSEEQKLTREINEYRYKMLNRREDIRLQKKSTYGAMNAIIAQLAIEDHLQSRLMSQAIALQRQAEATQAQADHHIASLNHQLQTANAELLAKSDQIRNYAIMLTNYYTQVEKVKEVRLLPAQLQTRIDASQKEADRTEKEAAERVAAVAASVDHNVRENEHILRQMAKFAVLQEDLRGEGVDITSTSTDEVVALRDTLYSDLTARSYREGKYTQTIRMLRERLNRRQRGENVQPLTLNKRVPLTERRARRDVMRRSAVARQVAQDHLRQHNQTQHLQRQQLGLSNTFTLNDTQRSMLGGKGGDSMSAFRSLVINFIKKEIQPLYDANQISKVRFVDVVSRTSSWFLANHQVATELTEANMTALTRHIQEVLTWQDEERLKMRV